MNEEYSRQQTVSPAHVNQSAISAVIGIDNGFSGAVACLTSEGMPLCEPVRVMDLGKERLLDLDGNQKLLRKMLAAAGVPKHRVLALYEQCQPNPLFGARNNFSNGKNGEFWRILLMLEGVPSRVINPCHWQKPMFRGIRGKDTKAMADCVRRQRFPNLDLSGFNKSEIEGMNDAICIALCARDLAYFSLEALGLAPEPRHEMAL